MKHLPDHFQAKTMSNEEFSSKKQNLSECIKCNYHQQPTKGFIYLSITFNVSNRFMKNSTIKRSQSKCCRHEAYKPRSKCIYSSFNFYVHYPLLYPISYSVNREIFLVREIMYFSA